MGKNTKGKEKLKTEEVESKPAYRYYCEACTNTAFTADKKEVGKAGSCQVCGKPYVTKKANYLPL